MCLDMRFKPEVEKKMIAKLPDGLITVYRRVKAHRGRAYRSLFFTAKQLRAGMNKAWISHNIGRLLYLYDSGYHSFRVVGAAKYWHRNMHATQVIKFQIRKEWITAIGKQKSRVVYVTDRIISPSLRDKSAVVG